VGIGDRFGKEGGAQLRAMQKAEQAGAVIVPVWNKSFREHSLIGTKPDDVRAEADAAVRADCLRIEGESVSESLFEFVFEGGWRWAWCGRL
jgi:hypothetical protein